MTWTQDGVDYVCQKYGDINECVVSGGLIFDFIDDLGNPFTGVTGSTADIVSLIAFGLASSITMTTPSRPTILNPEVELDNANKGTVTQPDAMELIDHDERSADQWCYIVPPPCSSYTDPVECEANDCYWYDDGTGVFCHDSVVCESIKNQPDCERLKCYWYDDTCHSDPAPCTEGETKCEEYDLYTCIDARWVLTERNSSVCGYIPPSEVPWLLYVGIATVVVGGIAIIIKKWR